MVVMVDGVPLSMKSLCMKSGVEYHWLKYLHEKYRLPISIKMTFISSSSISLLILNFPVRTSYPASFLIQ
jgi:hypothetical protein